jgi:nicotinamide-nucleotide amidase
MEYHVNEDLLSAINELEPLALSLGHALLERRLMMAAAESCTGGLIGAVLTSIAGSSEWFDRGFVTYSNEAKHQMLGVPVALIEQHGAVSDAVARAMAEGALTQSRAQSRTQMALSVTGIAGPGGGSASKPVGLVWHGFAMRGDGDAVTTQALRMQYSGDRARVRFQAARFALQQALVVLARVAR